jgi:hypothetical protein
MPTIDDLRAVLHDVSVAEAGDSAAMLDRLIGERPIADHPPRRRRTWVIAPIAAAALVVVLVIAAFAITRGGHRGQLAPPGIAALPLDNYVFTLGSLPDGLSWSYGSSATGQQSVTIETANRTDVAIVSVSTSSDGFLPLSHGVSEVDINGQTGYLTNERPADKPTASVPSGQSIPRSVFWQDPSGLWVNVDPMLVADEQGRLVLPVVTQAQVLATARAVQIPGLAAGAPATLIPASPVKVIIKFAYVPAGLKLADISEGEGGSHSGGLVGSAFGLIDPTNPNTGIGIGVNVAQPGQPAITPAAKGDVAVTIGSFTGVISADGTSLTNGVVNVTLSGPIADNSAPSLTRDDLTKLVEGITVASNPADRSTWFDADTVVPN